MQDMYFKYMYFKYMSCIFLFSLIISNNIFFEIIRLNK